MSGNNDLLRVPTSWGDITIQLQDGKVTGCILPHVDDTPAETFAVSSRNNNAVAVFICDTFRGCRTAVPPIGELQGSSFQKQVWRVLLEIPAGETRSYSAVAAAVGNPRACRAVANACGKNPAPLFVPCHRVIGTDKKLHGFSAGRAWKRLLLDVESKQAI